jgi:hypothetical protein
MAGLPKPKVVANIEGYHKRLDDAGSTPKVEPEAAPDVPVHKPTTAAEGAAKAAKYAKDRADFEAETKRGLPKPGLVSRVKKLIGL